ncbi:hypothetical protein sscle_01g000080 [Sclerotinia sclerotiorum 1980 UF-70]|uniref:BTB domain-containing protein n=1 Tax=Sclerotinia sclerotiorum (strain ATCC 18683 / 1980 / Ss-1) TaxID=665079 RepID=A0A1D9PRA2_SCLS1|nr:hypothetical protein sscle_01g000080 [Sclerotinia sclerotiorum 1980 UF-70]
MFGSNWQEGHDLLNHEGPIELSLPEDNAAALEIIFAIIHHQNNEVSRAIPARRVLDVAITTDKYDFINAMKLASETLLRTKKRGADDLMFLTAAAYLFQNAQAFKKITKALILKYPAPYLNLACKGIESVLTWRVFRLLEQQRSFASLELSELLISGINERTGMCVHMRGWMCKYTCAYLNLLKNKQLWPANLLGISVSEAIEAAENMADPIPRNRSIVYKYEFRPDPAEYRKGRYRSLERLKNGIGLCLQ